VRRKKAAKKQVKDVSYVRHKPQTNEPTQSKTKQKEKI
jgi:hypothetical protein